MPTGLDSALLRVEYILIPAKWGRRYCPATLRFEASVPGQLHGITVWHESPSIHPTLKEFVHPPGMASGLSSDEAKGAVRQSVDRPLWLTPRSSACSQRAM